MTDVDSCLVCYLMKTNPETEPSAVDYQAGIVMGLGVMASIAESGMSFGFCTKHACVYSIVRTASQVGQPADDNGNVPN